MDTVALWALRCGMTVPFLYYGSQALAAPFFPDFSVMRTTASELGSERAPYAAIFNVGIMIQGAVSLVAAFGFFRALRRVGTNLVLSALTSIAPAMIGVQTIWAGYYPMPDPRHGGHPAFVVAMILLPVLLTASLWQRGCPRLRTYLAATLLLLAAVFPLLSGLSGFDTHQYRGILQRVFTMAIFPPIGVGAFVLAHDIQVPASLSRPIDLREIRGASE